MRKMKSVDVRLPSIVVLSSLRTDCISDSVPKEKIVIVLLLIILLLIIHFFYFRQQ
jgi:hypothetical protein